MSSPSTTTFPPSTTVKLELATAGAVKQGLALLGLDWSPVGFEDMTQDPGLYMWVTPDEDLLSGGVLYVGIGVGHGGVKLRVHNEMSWSTEDAEHLHGRAMNQLNAKPIGGPVRFNTECDLSWLDKDAEGIIAEIGPAKVRAFLAHSDDSLVTAAKLAEPAAIRIAARLGCVAPPVNSTFTNAWATDALYDWAGFAVTAHLGASQGASAPDAVKAEAPDDPAAAAPRI